MRVIVLCTSAKCEEDIKRALVFGGIPGAQITTVNEQTIVNLGSGAASSDERILREDEFIKGLGEIILVNSSDVNFRNATLVSDLLVRASVRGTPLILTMFSNYSSGQSLAGHFITGGFHPLQLWSTWSTTSTFTREPTSAPCKESQLSQHEQTLENQNQDSQPSQHDQIHEQLQHELLAGVDKVSTASVPCKPKPDALCYGWWDGAGKGLAPLVATKWNPSRSGFVIALNAYTVSKRVSMYGFDPETTDMERLMANCVRYADKFTLCGLALHKFHQKLLHCAPAKSFTDCLLVFFNQF